MVGNRLFLKYFVPLKDTLRYIFEDKNTQSERLGRRQLFSFWFLFRRQRGCWDKTLFLILLNSQSTAHPACPTKPWRSRECSLQPWRKRMYRRKRDLGLSECSKQVIKAVVVLCMVTVCYPMSMYPAQEPNLYTQSQAQLKLKTVRDLLGKEFSSKVVPYFDIISQVLTREALYKNSYYAFYHTTSSKWTVVADLFAQLHVYFKPDDTLSSAQIMSEEFKKDGLIDDAGHMALLLLSVNFALFSNVGSQADNTWKSFIKDVQLAPSDKVYEKMMDIFGLSHKYIPEIMALERMMYTPEASLLQIFVPQEIVDQVIYLAWIDRAPAGRVALSDQGNFGISKQDLEQKFKNEQKNNPRFFEFMKSLHAGKMSAYAYLKDYCNKPLDVETINKITGKLLLTPEGLLDFGSGIKMYRYVTTSHEKITEYMAKLESLVQRLIAEKKQ